MKMEYKVFTSEEIEKAKTDIELRNEIVVNYYPLAFKLTSNFYSRIPRPTEQFDDYLNEALLGINVAIIKYDQEKNISFGTFVYSYIKWYIKSLSRRIAYGDTTQHHLNDNERFDFDRMQFTSTILDAPVEIYDNKTLKEVIEDTNAKNMTSNLEAEELWNIIKKHVTTKDYEFLYLRFVYEDTYDEIAKMFGCTKQNVNKSVHSSLARLREVQELKKYIDLL
jgi:RNA polymerase sigma factor (sigma-70 family)